MDYLIQPSALRSGTVSVPGDKSISHRALLLGAIAEGTTLISGFLAGEDCVATLVALRSLGVCVDQIDDTTVRVEGVGMHGLRESSEPLYLGNSGTGMRLLAGLLAAQSFDSTMTGDESLSTRPMQRIVDPLTMMGASIDTDGGKPPLVIHGGQNFVGIHYTLPVASAQLKSAILLAGLYARGETAVIEKATTRDHTERMLRTMGAKISGDSGHIRIHTTEKLEATDVQVPADLSSAAFLILAALIAKDADVLIRDVGVNPTRTGVIEILREMGGDISIENPRLLGEEPLADIRVKSSVLHGIAVDPALVSLAIDEFPVLFIAAMTAVGSTRFTGIGELRVKESDRIGAMTDGLRRMGIKVDESNDGAEVHYGEPAGTTIDSYGDHRVAMAFAVAGTIAEDEVRVQNVDAVHTSFPGFADAISSLGIALNVQ